MWKGRWRAGGLGARHCPEVAGLPLLLSPHLRDRLACVLLSAMGESHTFCARVPVRLCFVSSLFDTFPFQTTRQSGRHTEWSCIVGAERCLLSRRHSLRFQVHMILSSFLNAKKMKIVFYELP